MSFSDVPGVHSVQICHSLPLFLVGTLSVDGIVICAPGMMTGIILAMARAIGETAPLILVGAFTFVTFLPQFISASDPNAAGKLAFLGVYMVVFTAPIAAVIILGADKVVTNLKQRPQIMRAIDYAFAGIFGVFAVKVLLTDNK